MATEFQVPDPRKSELKRAWQKAAADVLFGNRQVAVTYGAISTLSRFGYNELQFEWMKYHYWFALPRTVKLLHVKADPMFQHNKGHCDVTKYAAQYASMKGSSPFQNTNSTSATKAKK
eukprot:gene6443-6672_t